MRPPLLNRGQRTVLCRSEWQKPKNKLAGMMCAISKACAVTSLSSAGARAPRCGRCVDEDAGALWHLRGRLLASCLRYLQAAG